MSVERESTFCVTFIFPVATLQRRQLDSNREAELAAARDELERAQTKFNDSLSAALASRRDEEAAHLRKQVRWGTGVLGCQFLHDFFELRFFDFVRFVCHLLFYTA